MANTTAMEQVTKHTALTSGGLTAVLGWGLHEWAAAIGATVAVLTLVMNFYFTRKRFALEKALIEKRLQEGSNPSD